MLVVVLLMHVWCVLKYKLRGRATNNAVKTLAKASSKHP